MRSLPVHPVRCLALLLFASAVLAGCSRERPPPCPDVRILAITSEMTKFRPGPGRDLTDVEYEVSTEAVAGGCAFRDENSRVEVEMTVTFVIERGPALQGDRVQFPYYIAIVTRDEQILAKEVFQSQAEFGQGQRRIGLTESSREVIPMPDGQISLDYEILVGLQLTEEQLAYNRRERGF
ncbi:hypothetical protein ACFOGJ_04650 [Marinibaculum pumilum]|uniref:Lipoprotein n=1 Tax=Marinibaculum pumilum TaxID=1766165 RepID=A0ABV7KVW4_9PROT